MDSTILSIIYRFIPFSVYRFALNIYYRFTSKVTVGRGTLLRPGNRFEGHNVIMNNSEVSYSRLGRYTYVASFSIIRYADIGSFCSIGDNVRICIGQHPTCYFSSHPQTFSLNPPSRVSWVSEQKFREHKYVKDSKKVVKIGSDVWIGSNVIIMDGITIGHGAIVAAGAIVTRDIKPYSICAGVPAKVIRYRFDNQRIADLLGKQWWDRDDMWIRENLEKI